jgi:hypothetical protein
VVNAEKACKKRKYLQFVTMFHLLKHAMPMTNYERMDEQVFTFLKVEKVPKVHWNDSFTWGMANCIHDVVLAITKHVIQKVKKFP